MKKKISLPGLNVQYPISQDILLGKKTIETRFYPLPKKYLKRPMWLIETPGEIGDFKARASAIITFDSFFEYKSKKEFYADTQKHLVAKDSAWAWNDDKNKWGWIISNIQPLHEFIEIKQRRGILFTSEITLLLPSSVQLR